MIHHRYQSASKHRCTAHVGWTCDAHGEPDEDIECGAAADVMDTDGRSTFCLSCYNGLEDKDPVRPIRRMTPSQALAELERCYPMRRKNWLGYVIDGIYVWPSGRKTFWVPTRQDVMTDDWERVD